MNELMGHFKTGVPILAILVILAIIYSYLPKKIQDFLGISSICIVGGAIVVGLFLYFSALIGMIVSLFI